MVEIKEMLNKYGEYIEDSILSVHFVKLNGKIQCIEARQVKQRIRKEYASKIDGYFFDILIHISDNVEEAKRTLNTVNKYDKYTIGNYVRKGYKSILNESTKCQSKSYVSFLENLRGDKDERE